MRIKLAYGRGFLSLRLGQADIDIGGPVLPAGYARGGRRLAAPVIARRVRAPLAGPPLRELAAGKRKGPVVILFDDLSRPTPAGLLARPVLAELEAAGVDPKEVVFLGATGSHRPMTPGQIEAKLGRAITSRYRAVSHDYRGQLVLVGRTSRGTPVAVNPLVAEAGLVIGLGSVFPHGEVGYSGGGKVLVPGVAGLETMAYNHINLGSAARTHDEAYLGAQRADLDEAAGLAGLGFIVNAILSPDLKVVEVFAGEPVPAHRRAVAYASSYFAPLCPGMALGRVERSFDGVLAGSGPFDLDIYQAERALGVASRLCGPGGVILWAAACSEGRGSHGVLERTAWRETRWAGLEDLGRRFTVILTSGGLAPSDAAELLPASFEFCPEPRAAAARFVRALRPEAGSDRPRVAHVPWAAVLNR